MEKQKILVVDDERTNLMMLNRLLKDRYEVVVTTDATEVLELMDLHRPSLILLDVMMPEIGGYDLCKLIRSKSEYDDIPVIFITAKDSNADEIKAFEAGAVDFITKPFHPLVVLARVSVHLELKKYRDILKESSYRDGLTGIFNRRKYDEYFEELSSLAIRKACSFSVVMIDIDFFKYYNDTYGHLQGDTALIKVATKITEIIRRKYDLVARYGGEEFVCLLIDLDIKNLKQIVERINKEIEQMQIVHEPSTIGDYLTVSIGVSYTKRVSRYNKETLKLKADKALYLSKETGRNKFSIINLDDETNE